MDLVAEMRGHMATLSKENAELRKNLAEQQSMSLMSTCIPHGTAANTTGLNDGLR